MLLYVGFSGCWKLKVDNLNLLGQNCEFCNKILFHLMLMKFNPFGPVPVWFVFYNL